MTSRETLIQDFERIFKTVEDEHLLLSQLTSMKKEIHEPMQEFIARFNQTINQIPANKRHTEENETTFFFSSQPSDITF